MSLVWLSLFACLPALGGDVVVPLTLTLQPSSGDGVELDFRKVGPSVWAAREPGGEPVTLRAAEGGGYWTAVDGSAEQLLEAGRGVLFTVRDAPYRLLYRRRNNGNEEFRWEAAYRFRGTGHAGECQVTADLSEGGELRVDEVLVPRHGPVTVCGSDWLPARVTRQSVVLTPANLPVPQLGRTMILPELTDAEGRTIQRQPGRFLLIDFWASWCAPCLESFPAIRGFAATHGDRLQVIGLNVDERDRVEVARKLAVDLDLSWPNVFRGFGDYEPLWRALAKATPERPLELPFYALLDPDGVLVFAGDGEGLRAALRRL